MTWLVDLYQKAPEYKALAAKTRKEFDRLAELVKAEFGARHVAAIERRHIKAWWRELIDKVSLDHANRMVNKAMRPIIRTAMDEGLIAVNPAAKLKLTGTPPRDQVWSDPEISKLCEASVAMNRPSIGLAVHLAYAIGQRPGDILRLSWTLWNGHSISLRQGKTKRWVDVKAMPELKAALDATTRTAVQMVINERTGRPYDGGGPARQGKLHGAGDRGRDRPQHQDGRGHPRNLSAA